MLLSFNSKLVRLKGLQVNSYMRRINGFNSKLVRLENTPRITLRMEQCSFNSKLVRLEVGLKKQSNASSKRFNSKLVRLKAMIFDFIYYTAYGFQFQTGSIKRIWWITLTRDTNSFNSKLVRLEVNSFNSKLVRLEVKTWVMIII